MKYFQTAAVLAAAALTFAGCKQHQQASNRSEPQGGPSVKAEQETIRDSAREAKKQINQQAKAQKDQVDAEARMAQARIDAEQAKAKVDPSRTEQAIQQSTEKIREAAGSASAKVQSESGSATSRSATPVPIGATTDQSLKESVCQALGLSDAAATATRNVQVKVDNGTVTLSGTVSSEQEKAQMEKMAKSIPGVNQVENQLQTVPQ